MTRKVNLGDALKHAGDVYLRENPADLERVRERVERHNKRQWFRFAAAGVGVAASIALGALAIVNIGLDRDAERAPSGVPLDHQVTTDAPPLHVEARGGSAFAALDDNSIVRVDLSGTRQVWKTGFASPPADVIWGQTGVWVTFPDEDVIVRLDHASGEEVGRIDLDPGAGPTRLTVGARALRVVVSTGVVRVDLSTGEQELLYEGDITDSAMGRRGFWLLNTRGAIFAVDPDTGVPVEGLSAETRTPGGEITFARNAIWYGRPGSNVLIMIDESSGGLRSRISLPGDYVDLDAGADGPWVLTGAGGDEGRITLLDPVSGELDTTSTSVGGDPVDLSTGAGGIWLVQNSASRIVHLTF